MVRGGQVACGVSMSGLDYVRVRGVGCWLLGSQLSGLRSFAFVFHFDDEEVSTRGTVFPCGVSTQST